jgi:hypothetical protein
MVEQQSPNKRSRAPLDKGNLTFSDKQVLERAAELLNKTVSQLLVDSVPYEDRVEESTLMNSQCGNVTFVGSQTWPSPALQSQTMDSWQSHLGDRDLDYRMFQPNGPWIHSSEPTFERQTTQNIIFNQWPENMTQMSPLQAESTQDISRSGTISRDGTGCLQGWSHIATDNEPWVAIPTDFLSRASLDTQITNDVEICKAKVSRELNTKTSQISSQVEQEISNTQISQHEQIDDFEIQNLDPPSQLNNQHNSDETDLDWEVLHPQISNSESQLSTRKEAATPSWSMIKTSEFHNKYLVDNLNSKSIKWVPTDPSAKEIGSQRPQRRGPFQNQHLREETSSTRKLKACVRCRMQKIRVRKASQTTIKHSDQCQCQIDNSNPSGACQTCQALSRPQTHTLPCVRYKITECTLYRTGKAPGLEFTFRWPTMKLRDILEWSDAQIRTIKVVSDVCPVPLELSVRRFVPIPQDSMQKSWMDGKVKKYKRTTPYAIVNMLATVKVMRDYIDNNVFQCMKFWLAGRDELIQKTYSFARQYMTTAVSSIVNLMWTCRSINS